MRLMVPLKSGKVRTYSLLLRALFIPDADVNRYGCKRQAGC